MQIKDSVEISIEIAKQVNKIGGKAYFVGGYVRDRLIEQYLNVSLLDTKPDIDIEIHGIENKQLENILSNLGTYLEFGKSFGIYSLADYRLDIGLPRAEVSTDKSHRGFEIEVDPKLGTYLASKRRDFTMNSIMQDILTNEYIDHFNGIEDIKNRLVRHVDDRSFVEDPLRVLRACQFASRFNFDIDVNTIELCKKMDIRQLSKERIFGEIKKALLNSSRPSVFFEHLNKMDHLGYWFKELEDLKVIEQNPFFHKEGNVYIHTMMIIDEAAKIIDQANEKLYFMFACLCHDFGKAVSTKVIDGRIRSIHHEIDGLPLVRDFISRISTEKKLLSYVLNMTELHMKPNMYAYDNSSIKKTNKLFYKSVDPHDLILLALADSRSRISEIKIDTSEYLEERFKIYKEYMSRPYVTGKDLIYHGIPSQEDFSKLISLVNKHRFAGIDKESSLKQVISYAKEIGVKFNEDKN